MKIGIVGTQYMAQSLSICLKKLGNKLVPLKDCNVCWIAIDTPVNQKGQGNIEPVLDAVKDVKSQLKGGTLVIVSSQIPVGTSKKIVKILGKKFGYAYIPETMRVGKGVSDFMNLSIITIGVDDNKHKDTILKMFSKKSVYFTSVATAEMVKHAINAFLAISLAFIYDIADICEAVGADVTDVAYALRSDHRIGQEAYLDASAGFSGGHLERDLDYLQKVAKLKKVDIPVIKSVIKKNIKRRLIVIDKLGNVKDKTIAFWGITYKPGVPPSASSLPAKLIRDLKQRGAKISIYDEAPRPYGRDIFSPLLRRERNPSEAEISSHSSTGLRPRFSAKGDKVYAGTDPYESVKNCMAIVCITPWEDLKKLDYKKISRRMVQPKIFFDARNYFADEKNVIEKAGIKYIGVGQ